MAGLWVQEKRAPAGAGAATPRCPQGSATPAQGGKAGEVRLATPFHYQIYHIEVVL
jgi:hypothetical protein